MEQSLMGPGYFLIAILGCADGGGSCTQVATLQTRYSTIAECSAATSAALENNSNFDFPTLLARCKPGNAVKSAEAKSAKLQSGPVRRG